MRNHTYDELVQMAVTTETGPNGVSTHTVSARHATDLDKVPPHVIDNLKYVATKAIENIVEGLPAGMQLSVHFTMLPEHVKELGEA